MRSCRSPTKLILASDMARARNIKPSFFTNEIIGTLDPIVGMTFIGLWCLADKTGRLEDRPLRIKAELFPYREGTDVNGYLTVLERNGFIERYEVDGIGYIQIVNFEKHQAPHHTERAKGYPPKPASNKGSSDLTVKPPLSDGEHQVSTRSDSLIPDSLIPDLLIEDSAPAAQAPKRAKPAVVRPEGVAESVWTDFLAIRKAKRAPLTATALDGIESEAVKAGMSLADVLALCCTRGWQGFKAEWVAKTSQQSQSLSFAERDELARRRRWEEMTGRKWPESGPAPVIDVTPSTLEIGQ